MAELSEIKIDGVTYDIMDATARKNSMAEYELIRSIVIDADDVTNVRITTDDHEQVLNLKKVLIDMRYPIIQEGTRDTGTMSASVFCKTPTSSRLKAYGAYAVNMSVPYSTYQYYHLKVHVQNNGGVSTGTNNCGFSNSLEHSARSNGPNSLYIGTNSFYNEIEITMGNAIPIGSTIEIYGVRS